MQSFRLASPFRLSAFILLMVSALLVTGCGGSAVSEMGSHVSNPKDGLWQNESESPFSFVLEQTWGEEDGSDEQLLPSVSSLVTDDEGNLYLYDRRAGQIISFASDGSYRWTAGNKGEGPGELNNVYGVIYHPDGYLYLFNQQGSRIDRFNLDGEYVDNQSTESFGQSMLFGIDFLDDHTLLASAPAWGILGAKVLTIDISTEPWTLVTSFTIDQTGDLSLPDGVSSGPDVVVYDGRIANSNIMDYLVEFRDTTGTVTASFSRDIDKLIRPGFYQSGNTSSISTYSSLGTPLHLGDNLFMIVSNWPKTAFDPDVMLKQQMDSSAPRPKYDVENVLDFYDSDNRLLYSLTTLNQEGLPFGGIIGSDSNGKLYALTKEPFPQIGRYRVEVNAPSTN